METESTLKKKQAELRDELRDVTLQLEKVQHETQRNTLRELFDKIGHKYVKFETGDGFECIGVASEFIEDEWGDSIRITNMVKRWILREDDRDLDLRTVYHLHYDSVINEGFKIQNLTKDEYHSLVFQLLNAFCDTLQLPKMQKK